MLPLFSLAIISSFVDGRHLDVRSKPPADLTSIIEINRNAGILDGFVEGDMRLPPKRRAQVVSSVRTWTDNTVFYSFDSSYFHDKNEVFVRNEIRKHFLEISERSCIRFEESATERNRVLIMDNGGCSADIGMFGGVQNMSLSAACINPRNIVHEAYHTLGYMHTHSRTDRDSFVTVDLTFVEKKRHHNFYKKEIMINHTTYDLGSIMHYPAIAFTFDPSKLSIIPKDKLYVHTIGSGQLAFTDIFSLNHLYGCTDSCRVNNCENGGFPNPNNCSHCLCPDGYGGELCLIGDGNSCFEATNTEQRIAISGDFEKAEKNQCIQSLPGQKLVVRIDAIPDGFCQYGCRSGFLELKHAEDRTLTGPRFCCTEDIGKEITSKTGSIIAITKGIHKKFEGEIVFWSY